MSPMRSTDCNHARLAAVVDDPGYPCLGARSVFHRDRVILGTFKRLGDRDGAHAVLEWLKGCASRHNPGEGLASFVATFRHPDIQDDRQFERLLWQELQAIHDVDVSPWSPSVSSDPNDDRFAFSAAGTAYFVIGLHPHASREARRAPFPTLVFNMHAQFDALRAEGKYERLRDTIRERDQALQGAINPMVADHGAGSEARQYSGRTVDETWVAPFLPRRAA